MSEEIELNDVDINEEEHEEGNNKTNFGGDDEFDLLDS